MKVRASKRGPSGDWLFETHGVSQAILQLPFLGVVHYTTTSIRVIWIGLDTKLTAALRTFFETRNGRGQEVSFLLHLKEICTPSLFRQ